MILLYKHFLVLISISLFISFSPLAAQTEADSDSSQKTSVSETQQSDSQHSGEQSTSIGNVIYMDSDMKHPSFKAAIRPNAEDKRGIRLQIDSKAPEGTLKIRFYNHLGRLLRESEHDMQNGNTVIISEADDLPAGKYRLQLNYQSEQRSLPFVKQ